MGGRERSGNEGHIHALLDFVQFLLGMSLTSFINYLRNSTVGRDEVYEDMALTLKMIECCEGAS